MKLSPEHATSIREALMTVERELQLAQQQPDTEATKAALQRVRSATLSAISVITDAETETSAAAWDAMIRKRTQSLESIA